MPATPAQAKLEHHLSILVADELWVRPETGTHGWGLINYRLGGLPRGAQFVLDYNSESLRLAYEKVSVAGGKLELGGEVKGEALLAGVLTDYYRHGRSVPQAGFNASYISAGGYLKSIQSPHYLELALTGRRWFFNKQGATGALFTLPPEIWVGEVRARYTLWMVDPDPSLWEAHRPFPRVSGWAFGLEAGLDFRSAAQDWGARDVRVLDPPDYRNHPGSVVVQVKQWFYGGVYIHPRLRVQVAETAVSMWNEDDLVRVRIGGMNPYVVPLAGAPWASFLAGREASADLSLHIRTWRELETGVVGDIVVVDDFDRTGNPSRPSLLFGAAAFGDFRYKAWQFDLRAGWCPTIAKGDLTAWSVLGSVGWGLNR
jgi:hypothetical protein